MLNHGWQLDHQIWQQIPYDLINSQSWRYVGFTGNEAVVIPEGKPGVYAFCTSPVGRRFLQEHSTNDLFSNLLTPIYIGKTDNLRRRFLQHCRSPSPKLSEARQCFGDSMLFWFHPMNQEQISEVEAILIQCFGPTANERTEKIKGILGNPISIGIQDKLIT